MGAFFELGKAKAAEGERWVRLSSAVPKIQWDSNPPLPLRLLGYGKPLPFISYICSNITTSASLRPTKGDYGGNNTTNHTLVLPCHRGLAVQAGF